MPKPYSLLCHFMKERGCVFVTSKCWWRHLPLEEETGWGKLLFPSHRCRYATNASKAWHLLRMARRTARRRHSQRDWQGKGQPVGGAERFFLGFFSFFFFLQENADRRRQPEARWPRQSIVLRVYRNSPCEAQRKRFTSSLVPGTNFLLLNVWKCLINMLMIIMTIKVLTLHCDMISLWHDIPQRLYIIRLNFGLFSVSTIIQV